MATLLSAPTLSASQFAEYMDPEPLYQCPRSATPTMSRSRSRLHRDLSCSTYASTSASGSGLYRTVTRDERDRSSRDHRRRGSSPPSPSASKRWSISLVRPRLRRSESDEPPRRSSRSRSPPRVKSTKSASVSHPDGEARYSVFAAFSGFGSPLRKVEKHTALAERRVPSPQPLPCLEACTGPPSPTVETFSSTASTLIEQHDPFSEYDYDDGIIWVVPRSRRGSRASSFGYGPTKPTFALQHSIPEPQSMADLKRDMHCAGFADAPPSPSRNRRLERISNWGLPHSPKEDKMWSKLTVMWWRRKSA